MICCLHMRTRQQTKVRNWSSGDFWEVISRLIRLDSYNGQQHDKTTGWKLAGNVNQTDLGTVSPKLANKGNSPDSHCTPSASFGKHRQAPLSNPKKIKLLSHVLINIYRWVKLTWLYSRRLPAHKPHRYIYRASVITVRWDVYTESRDTARQHSSIHSLSPCCLLTTDTQLSAAVPPHYTASSAHLRCHSKT